MIPSSLPIIVEAGQGETTLLPENASQVWKATGETTNGALEGRGKWLLGVSRIKAFADER